MDNEWEKIDELEYSHKYLASIYEKISDINNQESIDNLIKDEPIIQLLKDNNIPYKCQLDSRIVKNKEHIPRCNSYRMSCFFIEIFIPKNYIAQFNSTLTTVSQKDTDNFEQDEVYDENYEKFLNFQKIRKRFSKIFILTLFALTALLMIFS